MKTKTITYIFTILGVLVIQGHTNGQIKIGDNLGNHKAAKELDMNNQKIINAAGLIIGASAFSNNSIQLELTAGDKALLFNRVASLSAINTPIDGMAVYNSSDNKFYVRQGGSWISFTSTTDAVTSLTATNVGTAANSKGISLNASKGDVTVTLQPADNINPGIITAGAQTFGGDKTFAGNSTFANAAITGVASFTGLSISTNVNDVIAVIDATGTIKKSTLMAGSINKLNVPIPIGTSALFVSDNMIITITLTVNGIKQDDGVVVNFSTADLPAFNGLSIINALASADNTIKVSIADSRNPADPLYAAVAIDSKNLVVTYLHK
jgi:hypothetical protein